jgi:hypothetical protein
MPGRSKRADTETVIAYVHEVGIADVSDIARRFDMSTTSARNRLDAGVYRGELVRDEYDAAGDRLGHEHWRYCPAA